MKDSKDYMLKLQQMVNVAVNLWLLSPHTLTEQESVYLNAAMGGLENAIPLLTAASREDPTPEPEVP